MAVALKPLTEWHPIPYAVDMRPMSLIAASIHIELQIFNSVCLGRHVAARKRVDTPVIRSRNRHG
jgi:hypothetical protein